LSKNNLIKEGYKIKHFLISYGLYDLRWILCAVPGAILLAYIQKKIKNQFWSMIISQAILGLVVFWIDLFIFGGIK
jgi:hypothetical protein